MSSEADVKFEIGHVLFIDIVGYSKLLIHEQTEQLQKLGNRARNGAVPRCRSRRQIAASADRRRGCTCF